jgi:fumarate hydratase subunit beta
MSDVFRRVATPLTAEVTASLTSGDQILLSGKVYAARDAAHALLVELLDAGKPLPIDLEGQVIYYVGPSPARPGRVIGAAGPTTSSRMDAYSPRLIGLGLKGMIGKGSRSQAVKDAMVAHKAVYLGAVGGAAAVISQAIKSVKVIAWPELGPEALREMEVEDFPLTVINDTRGGDLYLEGKERYRRPPPDGTRP